MYQLPAIRLLFFVFVGLLSFSCSDKDFERPNIILIMADDLGYGDLGCYGSQRINTPEIDKLAAEGLRFTDFHSNGSVCSPTRAALLTGRYQQRSGMEGVVYASGETRHTGMDVNEVTMADYLKKAGYKTGMVGKWHLGYRIDYNPVYQGFDLFRGYVSGNVDYHSHVDNSGVPDWWYNLEKVEEEGYVTDLITQHALDFIHENQNDPFFLYVAHEAPHVPFQGRNDKADRFPGVDFDYQGSVKDKERAFKEMIEVMDEGVGRIIGKLKELNLEKNTLVVFCSDNGGLKDYADNGSLHGYKGSLWEGGHRVPAIAYWPGNIKPGVVSNETVLSMDFFPTFVNLSKSQLDPGVEFDGQDLTQLLLGEENLQERTVFWRYRNQKVARNSKWKLLVDRDSTFLFDLNRDIAEQANLINIQPAKATQLKAELEVWEAEVTKGVKLKTR
jgi:arylsulfatase A-like enzyme